MNNKSIALNFLPVKSDNFSFTVYRKKFAGEKKEDLSGGFALTRNSLPIMSGNSDMRNEYWISFEPKNGFEKFESKPEYNNKLTQKWLFFLLTKKLEKLGADAKLKYEKREEFRKRLFFILEKYKEGNQTIWIEPYYLKSAKKFGFLIDFKFNKNPDALFTRKIQQLSLSLDKNFRSNRNFYIDRYNKVRNFIDNYFSDLFPLRFNNESIDVEKEFFSIDGDALDTKKYIFADPKRR